MLCKIGNWFLLRVGKYLVTVDDQVKAYIKRIMAQLNKWMTGGKISKLVIVITSKETGENVERWQFDVCFFLSPLLAFPPLSFYVTFCNRPFWREISLPHYSTGWYTWDHLNEKVNEWRRKEKKKEYTENPPKAKIFFWKNYHQKVQIFNKPSSSSSSSSKKSLPPSSSTTTGPQPNENSSPALPQQQQQEKSEAEIQKEIQSIFRQITASVTFLPQLDGPCTFNVLVYADADSEVPMEWGDSDAREIKEGEKVQLRGFSTGVHGVGTSVSYRYVLSVFFFFLFLSFFLLFYFYFGGKGEWRKGGDGRYAGWMWLIFDTDFSLAEWSNLDIPGPRTLLKWGV